jgi:serine/threonine protein phosphatase PrpC
MEHSQPPGALVASVLANRNYFKHVVGDACLMAALPIAGGPEVIRDVGAFAGLPPTLFVAADGNGTGDDGWLAVGVALTTLASALASPVSAAQAPHALREAVLAADRAVREAKSGPPESRLRTLLEALPWWDTNSTLTEAAFVMLTAALFVEEQVYFAHVGATAAFVFRNGKLERATSEQTYIEALIRSGKATEEDRDDPPQQHIVLQGLGTGHEIYVELAAARVFRGDRFLLCTDGLTHKVSFEEIQQFLAQPSSPAELCTACTQLACDRGGEYDASVIVIDATGAGYSAPDARDLTRRMVARLNDDYIEHFIERNRRDSPRS